MAKLVDILARELKEWPEGVYSYAQNDSGIVGASKGVQTYTSGAWATHWEWSEEAKLNGKKIELSEDNKTSQVTKDQWQEAKKKLEGWKRHRGGNMPVDYRVVVEYRLRDGSTSNAFSDDLCWRHDGEDGDIMSYRVINDKPAIEPAVVENVDESNAMADVNVDKSMAEKYPQYYKNVANLDYIDVYQVHELFGIDDPSGAIQHASKKLLLSGVRTGGKSKADDIREARDTLTRWLEIYGGDHAN